MSPLRPIARRALATQSDERLVRLVREGHDPAFEEIVRRYRAPLVAFATAIVSHNRAEDVVQASLSKAHQALLNDSREITLRPWLFTIVRNGSLNTIRNEPQGAELFAGAATVPGPSEVAEQHEDLERLVLAICALPVAQRQALVKRELEGVGHGEIAAQLGTTSTAVRGLIFRARTTLRDAVGAALPLPVVRTLMTEAPMAAGLAGGGAGTAGIALLGGAGAKGGTAIAAAIVALGTGIAIDRGGNDDGSPARDGATVALQQSARDGGNGAANTTSAVTTSGTQAAASSESGPGNESSGSSGADSGSGSAQTGSAGGSGPSGGSGSAGPGSGASSDEDPSGSGPNPGPQPDDDHDGHGPGGDPDDDSSGPGPGEDDGSGHEGPSQAEDDNGGTGPSGSDDGPEDDSSGPSGPDEDEPDVPDVLDPLDPDPVEDDDNSGPGPGLPEVDHDNSGPGALG